MHKGPKRPDGSYDSIHNGCDVGAARRPTTRVEKYTGIHSARDLTVRDVFKGLFILSYMFECFAYMYVCVPHVCLVTMEAGRSFGTGIRDGCELPCMC